MQPMCDQTWRQIYCSWSDMLKSMPFSYGKSSSLIAGQCKSETGKNTVRVMLGGIEPLSVVVCLVTILVVVHFLPFVWYFIKFCFRAIKNPDADESPLYRQRREEIHEELHQDMSRQQLQHSRLDDRHQNSGQYVSSRDSEDEEIVEEPHLVYPCPNMVDCCIQVHPRNLPRRRVSLASLNHAHSRMVGTCQAGCNRLHQAAGGDMATPHHSRSGHMREPECAWPDAQHYDESRFACHRSSSCGWIRYPPYSLHQAPGVVPTPRLMRYTTPLEVASTTYKNEPTQTTREDFIHALQKCRLIRQTRSGAVYSVYF